MRLAINNGDVVWHAGPMNMQYEFFMDPTLLDMALDISFGLDREFNIQRTTPVVSQRDVPGELVRPRIANEVARSINRERESGVLNT